MRRVGERKDGKPSAERKKHSHVVRSADGGRVTFARYTRKLAVKVFCTECLGWEGSPADCTAPLCPLYPFRERTLATMRGVKTA